MGGAQPQILCGLVGGGDPTRYEENPDQGDTFNLNEYRSRGAWERPISIYRCGMSWINQARADIDDAVGGVSWIGLDRPAACCFMPFFVGVHDLPKPMQTMDVRQLDRGSAWWAFNYVANYATLRYAYMMKDVRAARSRWETQSFKDVAALTKTHGGGAAPDAQALDELSSFCEKRVNDVVTAWWELADRLAVKYNDGSFTEGESIMKHIGYPNRHWLEAVGYYRGPTQY